jgi:Omp85 superfamily domain
LRDLRNGKILRRTAGWIVLPLLACLLQATACTTMVARNNLPYPLATDRFGDPVKVVTIPLPVIAASPNEGVTYGGLTAFLLHNANDEVDTLVAPQLNYNPNFGITGTVYGTFSMSPERDMEFNASKSTKVNEDFEIRIRDKTFLDRRLELTAFLFAFTDGSARFFGFHATSPQETETNFGDREIGFVLSTGYDVGDHVRIVGGERLRNVNVVGGAIASLPFTPDVFDAEAVPGIGGFTAHAQKLAVVYDTTDTLILPTRGVFASASAEGSFKALGSSADFFRFELEAKEYLPLLDDRVITAGRFALTQVRGSDVPFLERSILGGENTLRGFGRDRFIDMGAILLNIEERIRVLRYRLFNVDTHWEVAPFVDIGTVMESLDRIDWRKVQINPGIGFRAAARPNVLGRIDVGYGKEGIAVYVGLKYPF